MHFQFNRRLQNHHHGANAGSVHIWLTSDFKEIFRTWCFHFWNKLKNIQCSNLFLAFSFLTAYLTYFLCYLETSVSFLMGHLWKSGLLPSCKSLFPFKHLAEFSSITTAKSKPLTMFLSCIRALKLWQWQSTQFGGGRRREKTKGRKNSGECLSAEDTKRKVKPFDK